MNPNLRTSNSYHRDPRSVSEAFVKPLHVIFWDHKHGFSWIRWRCTNVLSKRYKKRNVLIRITDRKWYLSTANFCPPPTNPVQKNEINREMKNSERERERRRKKTKKHSCYRKKKSSVKRGILLEIPPQDKQLNNHKGITGPSISNTDIYTWTL